MATVRKFQFVSAAFHNRSPSPKLPNTTTDDNDNGDNGDNDDNNKDKDDDNGDSGGDDDSKSKSKSKTINTIAAPQPAEPTFLPEGALVINGLFFGADLAADGIVAAGDRIVAVNGRFGCDVPTAVNSTDKNSDRQCALHTMIAEIARSVQTKQRVLSLLLEVYTSIMMMMMTMMILMAVHQKLMWFVTVFLLDCGRFELRSSTSSMVPVRVLIRSCCHCKRQRHHDRINLYRQVQLSRMVSTPKLTAVTLITLSIFQLPLLPPLSPAPPRVVLLTVLLE